MCSDLYGHFVYMSLVNAARLHLNYLPIGVYHSGSADHNKDVIVKSMSDAKGVVRVVFATVAFGMGINLVVLNEVVHYDAPCSLDNYFQQSGEEAFSTIYIRDAPMYIILYYIDPSDQHKHQLTLVR